MSKPVPESGPIFSCTETEGCPVVESIKGLMSTVVFIVVALLVLFGAGVVIGVFVRGVRLAGGF